MERGPSSVWWAFKEPKVSPERFLFPRDTGHRGSRGALDKGTYSDARLGS